MNKMNIVKPIGKVILLSIIAFSAVEVLSANAQTNSRPKQICFVRERTIVCRPLKRGERETQTQQGANSECPPKSVIEKLDAKCKAGNEDSCGGVRRIRESGCK